MKRQLLIGLLSAWCWLSVYGVIPIDTVVIKGYAKEYAGINLILQTVGNPISAEKHNLASFQVDEKGNFYHSFPVSEITPATLDVGRFRGTIYFEPGKSYELVLPPFEPRSDADRFNPFFIPENVVIGIANGDAQQLNNQIRDFQDAFSTRYDANAFQIFSTGDKQKASSIIHELDSIFPASTGSYFENYKHYTYGQLEFLSYKRQKKTVMTKFFGKDSVYSQLPAYWETFNLMFKDFFTYYFPTKSGRSLRNAFREGGNFDTLSLVLSGDPLFAAEEFRETVLLKGMYDAFYSGRYEDQRLIDLFHDASENGCNNQIKSLARGLHKKVNWLRIGSQAPDFNLYRINGNEKSLKDYKGQFIYLNFMHTDNHACMKDLQLLDVISKKMKREVRIVTIIMDDNPDKAKRIIKENKYKWEFLHYLAQADIALDYNIKALPTYFLIDPDGILRLSPAPSPEENFAPLFLEAVRSYRNDQMRKNRPKEKSIYDL